MENLTKRNIIDITDSHTKAIISEANLQQAKHLANGSLKELLNGHSNGVHNNHEDVEGDDDDDLVMNINNRTLKKKRSHKRKRVAAPAETGGEAKKRVKFDLG